jgi:hypothetical protein
MVSGYDLEWYESSFTPLPYVWVSVGVCVWAVNRRISWASSSQTDRLGFRGVMTVSI